MTHAAPVPFALRRGRRGASAGFTLVELVLVVMVLGVLAGIAAPRYSAAMTAVQLEAAAKQLAADLRRAQTVAMAKATSVAVSIDPATETYRSTSLPDLKRPTATLSENVAARGHGVQISASTFGAGTNVTFNFRGEPTVAGAVTIAAGSQTAVITVNDLGLVEVSL